MNLNFTEEQVIKIIESCFHALASSYTQEAKEYALQLMDYYQQQEKEEKEVEL